jgi:hypothetical protein
MRLVTLTRQQAAVVASVLSLATGAAYLLVLYAEEHNPRRLFLVESWPRVPVGASEVTAFQAMGPPDESRAGREAGCVREHVWYEWAREQVGRVYILCSDESGVIRSKDAGMAFNLRSW